MDWPWDSQCRQISSSETKGDTWAAEKRVEGTISQIKQKKRSDIDRHREGNKNKKRDNETCMKNLNHGGIQGLVKAHCSSSAVCAHASEDAVSCMEWTLRSFSSKLLPHHATKTVNSNTLAILTHASTRPCLTQHHCSEHMDLCCKLLTNWEVRAAALHYLLLSHLLWNNLWPPKQTPSPPDSELHSHRSKCQNL